MSDGVGDDIDLIWGPKPGAENGATVAPISSPGPAHAPRPAVVVDDDDPLAALESMTGEQALQHTEHASVNLTRQSPTPVDELLIEPVSARQRPENSPIVAAEKIDVLAAMNRAREKAHRENFGTTGPSVLAPPETTGEVTKRAPSPVEIDATTLPSRPVVSEQIRARELPEVPQSAAEGKPVVAADVVLDDWSTPVGTTSSSRVSATPLNGNRSIGQTETTERHQPDDVETVVHHRPLQRPTTPGGIRKGFVVIAAGLVLLAVGAWVFFEPVKRLINSDIAKPVASPWVEPAPQPTSPRVQGSAATGAVAAEQTAGRQPQGSDTVTTAAADVVTRVGDSPYVSPFQAPPTAAVTAPALAAKSVPPSMPGHPSSPAPITMASGGPIANQPQGQGQLRLSTSEPDIGKEKFAEIFGAQDVLRKEVDGINKRLSGFKTSFDSMSKKVDSFDVQLAEIRRIVAELKRTPAATARLNAPSQTGTITLPAPIATATPAVIAKAVKLQAIVPDFAVIGIDNDARTVKVGDEVPSLGRVARIDVANTRVTFESGYVLGIH